LYLAVDSLKVVLLIDDFFIENLDGNFFLGGLVHGYFDLAEGAFTNCLF